MSLASSIPSFLYPFTTTSFSNKPTLGNMNDEEGMDKSWTHILEGLHWMNEVSLRNKARATDITARGMEFDKPSDCIAKLRSIYSVLEREKIELM
ncbi:unnamed protein product [Lactuca virosa]|uniref:Uncharacterized protein n=1 Tax=Lactuca virosa TaxID=75947 RepID=A0AAU9LPB5_9ASTR|nr:unnamed protein product [Lactuca virosa]